MLRCTAGALGFSTFAVLLYNIFGMFVTEDVGAAARTVLENARTLLVWLVSAVTASFQGLLVRLPRLTKQ